MPRTVPLANRKERNVTLQIMSASSQWAALNLQVLCTSKTLKDFILPVQNDRYGVLGALELECKPSGAARTVSEALSSSIVYDSERVMQ
ncbi:hypothetical protein CC1G_07465 [Coprinopsis cinerea okayama7|uniref:Uncharacterized protein n=1 Tax=Coprinopsis cinerea (strain Okayama-7 / 130 / ATCC MYA-4618 / FGSC 9003) TaxID=240176 RepID=A8NB95_COPC7|nr:hypothetical protein CC1G_07465 [Coprinopsis cinerea okayama7\|eukprot:XP_001832094.2 hypothetical protein CC1G_07465 [Coprinopsis cinerea okayama7\